MTDDDFSKRLAKADEDLLSYLKGRTTLIGSNADAVRMFHPHILAMRQAGAAWPEIAAKLKVWSGRDVAPATIKQYMTDIAVGRMKLELSSTVRLADVVGSSNVVVASPDRIDAATAPHRHRSESRTAQAEPRDASMASSTVKIEPTESERATAKKTDAIDPDAPTHQAKAPVPVPARISGKANPLPQNGEFFGMRVTKDPE